MIILKKLARRIIDSARTTSSGIASKINRRRLTAILENFGNTGKPKYFFEINPDCLPANMVENSQLKLLGYNFDLQNHKLWNYSPDSKSCWPVQYYKEYNLLDKNCGDYKLIWELGRLQFLPGLLAADRESGLKILASFLWEVRPLYSIHWFSEMEIAIRMITLMLSLGFLQDDELLLDRSCRAINIHYHFLKDNLTTHWKLHNNHLLVETVALMCYEMLFESSAIDTNEQLDKHWRLLETECDDQIYPDGGIGEQSTSYTRFNLDAFLLLCVVCRKTGEAIPAWLKHTIYAMLDFLAAIRQPDNHWPMIGDGDDGRVIPPAAQNQNFWDSRGHFAAAYEIFGEPSFADIAGDCKSDFDWLNGTSTKQMSITDIENTLQPVQKYFTDSGYWVRKNLRGDYCLFRCGDFGLGGDGFAPHSHCDEMSLILWLAGEKILTDCGTGTYEPRDGNWRKYFQSCRCHNVVEVDSLPQAEPKGNFSWGKNPACNIIRADQNFVTGEFTDYKQLYKWTRSLHCSTGEIAVTDSVKFTDTSQHRLSWYFNLAPDATACINTNVIEITTASRKKFTLGFNHAMELKIDEVFYSESYNNKKAIVGLSAKTVAIESIEVEWKICIKS